tara:strand:+ start:1770 stop:2327 length:558 start_codon:yes stop_codon:yes gene_type:complete
MTILEKLQKIQVELKVTKNQTNAFGKYKYRSAEDILEAVKPFEEKYKVVFKINDVLSEVAGHVYVDSEAKIIDAESTDRESSISSTAQAIIDFSAKGMQMPQRTGAASSYAKKYALGNLLLIDDNKDADATNTHDKKAVVVSKAVLKIGSPEYNKVAEFMSKGGELDKVKLKYNVSAEVEKSLKF